MEQANTDKPKARSTRKGKPPETSSEDSYRADGQSTCMSQWSVAEDCELSCTTLDHPHQDS